MTTLLVNHPLLAPLSVEQRDQLDGLSEIISVPAGETFVQEGETSFDFYYIVTGTVEVLKASTEGHTHRISVIDAGSFVGELALLENGKRSASLRALEATTLMKIAGDRMTREARYAELFRVLIAALAKTVAERLRDSGAATVQAMQKQLVMAKEQIAQGIVMVTIILIMATYSFLQGLIALLKHYFTSTTPISVGILLLFAVMSFVALKRTGYDLSYYGFTLDNWQHVTMTAVLYSLPVMGVILLIKWMAIPFVPALAHEPLIHPFAVIAKTQVVNPWSYLATPLAYAAFCPVQEFIVRGAMQSSFQLFLKSHKGSSSWTAIVLSNLLFAAVHTHTTFVFALLAFVPGLFWGWLYAKQGSLLGVSVSHTLIGVWAVFIVSFSHLV